MRKMTNYPFLWIIFLLFYSCVKKSDEPINDKDEPILTYDKLVLNRNPVGFWLTSFAVESDASTYKHSGKYVGSPTSKSTLPNGDDVNVFNGADNCFEIADAPHLEIVSKGVITIEAWMRPDVENFAKVEADKDYIHWMGKGTAGQHSWVARMYNKDSWRENRPQRISGYAFNLTGGLGAGSYFQDVIEIGEWIHYVLVINTTVKSSTFPTGYTAIYKNGKLRQQRNLIDYNIIPEDGNAPIRIGTRDFGSFFKGAIGKVAIYDYELTKKEIEEHYNQMVAK